MSDLQIVDRKNLFDSSESDHHIESESDSDSASESDTQYHTALDFDFEVVDVDEEKEKPNNEVNDPEEGEKKVELFPMFSMGPSITSTDETSNETDGKKDEFKSSLIQVNLDADEEHEMEVDENAEKAALDEYVKNQKRPHSYYFAEFTEEQKKQFKDMALTGEQVLEMSRVTIPDNYKVINLNQFNQKIGTQNNALKRIETRKRAQEEKKKKTKLRLGKNQRLKQILSKQRKRDFRKELAKIEERQKNLVLPRRLVITTRQKKQHLRFEQIEKQQKQQEQKSKDNKKKQSKQPTNVHLGKLPPKPRSAPPTLLPPQVHSTSSIKKPQSKVNANPISIPVNKPISIPSPNTVAKSTESDNKNTTQQKRPAQQQDVAGTTMSEAPKKKKTRRGGKKRHRPTGNTTTSTESPSVPQPSTVAAPDSTPAKPTVIAIPK
ncbi:unnamed protein product [Ambrosiozyma monospora]|uniref:Unnamed protein product n=1 Tax=Ambrosiozyma monospora TaxID=43982 RepID=A0ACB5SXM9_AMBMO|nr:unnamed protein product [Ambrosiozyma monospora]